MSGMTSLDESTLEITRSESQGSDTRGTFELKFLFIAFNVCSVLIEYSFIVHLKKELI